MSRERSLEELLGKSSQLLGRMVSANGTSPSHSAQQQDDESRRAVPWTIRRHGWRRREMSVVLADALAELTADYREVIVLRSIEELEWGEVAKKMNRSQGAVRLLWARALKRLRPLIESRL